MEKLLQKSLLSESGVPDPDLRSDFLEPLKAHATQVGRRDDYSVKRLAVSRL
jgi:hypothetical protein